MIGRLTIDKASMNISYFLYTIKIIAECGGKISRVDFVNKMATFLSLPAIKNGKENRTPYNKSKLPRYFGFVDIETNNSREIFLKLTNRGERLAKCIKDTGGKSETRYQIDSIHKNQFIEMIYESILFDSFGKNNCGVEESNTDIEAPKIIFKTLADLGEAYAEEIFVIIFGLNKNYFDSFNSAIHFIKNERVNGLINMVKLIEEWDLVNFVNDCKLIKIFADENIGLINFTRDENSNKYLYRLSSKVTEFQKKQLKKISAFYQPLNFMVYVKRNIQNGEIWIKKNLLGRVSDSRYIFNYYNDDNVKFSSLNDSTELYTPHVFEKALAMALRNQNKNVYILFYDFSEEQISDAFGPASLLLKRVNNFQSPNHGWSELSLNNNVLYDYLIEQADGVRELLPPGIVKLPSNLHILGVKVMSDNDNKIDFDYEFTRCLIDDRNEPDEIQSNEMNTHEMSKNRILGGENILLYGVPGSGKSWTIENEYCQNGCKKERVVFHPDYTYSDFVGQILPQVNNGQVTYAFTPGPFTDILKSAYENPRQMHVLIIEEINRGNAPAIFGEIFQLLDRVSYYDDKNNVGKSLYGISNKNIAEVVFGDSNHSVKIPPNLFIIATMNTSDQNVFTLDTAFQRRWSMRLIENDLDNLSLEYKELRILDTDVMWRDFCKVTNQVIISNNKTMFSSEDKRLGGYFINASDLKSYEINNELVCPDDSNIISPDLNSENTNFYAGYKNIQHNRRFAEKVLKYLWDDAFKFNREQFFDVKSYSTLDSIINAFSEASGNNRFCVIIPEVREQLFSKSASGGEE